MFFEIHKKIDRTSVIILSDEGSAFKEGQKSVLTELGFKQHITYPPPVHQYLSVNDNNYHGHAKCKHRAMHRRKVSDVTWSLSLMRCLYDVKPKVISSWWDRNFLKGKSELHQDDALALVGFPISSEETEYEKLYINFSENQKTSTKIRTYENVEVPVELRTGLDGAYYSQSKN